MSLDTWNYMFMMDILFKQHIESKMILNFILIIIQFILLILNIFNIIFKWNISLYLLLFVVSMSILVIINNIVHDYVWRKVEAKLEKNYNCRIKRINK